MSRRIYTILKRMLQKPLIPSGADLNDYLTPGKYRLNILRDYTNIPSGYDTYVAYMEVFRQYSPTSSNYTEQRITIGANYMTFCRRWTGTEWSSWVTLINTNIGTLYEKNSTVSCTTATSVKAYDVSLPAGTYIIVANAQWPVSSTALTIATIYDETNKGTLAITRGTMNAGGGDTVARILSLSETTSISLRLYHAQGATQTAAYRFGAVRIK